MTDKPEPPANVADTPHILFCEKCGQGVRGLTQHDGIWMCGRCHSEAHPAIDWQAREAAAYRAGAEAMRKKVVEFFTEPVEGLDETYWLSYAHRQLVAGLIRTLPIPEKE